MSSSGALRGKSAAWVDNATTPRAAKIRSIRIKQLVYRSVQSLDAGDEGALAPQLETAVVAGAGDGVGGLARHRHLLPLLLHHLAVGGKVAPRIFVAVPLRCIEQHHTPHLLALHQLECRSAPVRRDLSRALLAGE